MTRAFPTERAVSIRAAVLLTLCLAAPALARPAAGPARTHAAAGRQLAPARLELLPAAFRLDGPNASQRVIVSAVFPDGRRVDVTDRAQLTAAPPGLLAIQGNRVTARGDGRARLAARFGKLVAEGHVLAVGTRRPVRYSFVNDVVPVLARLGCSSGTCHGANSGKGGFRLSLRGYAPELDYLWITRQLGGRRIRPEAPEQSLLLRKPLLEVPHGGGKRLVRGSDAYAILLGWLLQGAPGPDPADPHPVALEALPAVRSFRPGESQRVLVRARFSDGRLEDVTDRAVFRSSDESVAAVTEDGEVTARSPGIAAVQAKYQDRMAVLHVTVPFPRPARAPVFPPASHFVDRLVYARLKALNLEPSPLCTDAEFLRRAYLAAIGTLPTPDEARRFLDSRDPAKRERLIQEVLARPEFGSVWALKLCDLSMVRREHMGRKNTLMLHQWLTEQFRENRPWDRIVTDLLTASGPVEENPATLWWVSRQQVRPNARGWVRHYELTAEIVAQVFLGQRIQCAKCHNHPTESHTQDDYYRFAALFAQVNGDGRADPVPERLVATDPGEVRHPRTGRVVPPQPPDHTDLKPGPGEDRRVKFAEWLTRGPGRTLFARNIANRVWARLFGLGIVEPVDHLSPSNPPVNEPLLDALAAELLRTGYDLKALIATIMRSRTFQASCVATPGNRVDTRFFSHYPAHRLPAEELADAIAQATGVPERFGRLPLGTRAIELSDSELPSLLLDTFGRPNRTTPCECDRSGAPSLSQALALFNGDALQEKLRHPDGTVARLLGTGAPDDRLIEELFLTALSRRPSPAERAAALRAIAAAPKREEGVQDVLWALINSKEFLFVH